VIAVGVQLLLPFTVTLMVVLALRLPEVPFTVMVAEPEAELLAERLMVLPLTVAVTPEFELLALSETDPLKPFRSFTVMESEVLEPALIVTEDEAGESVKLPPLVGALMVKAWVLVQPAVLV
jgi:hypothetical protein